MKKLILAILFMNGLAFAQKNLETQSVNIVPPPPGPGQGPTYTCSKYYIMDYENDGTTTFSTSLFYTYLRAKASMAGYNLSGYSLQLYPSLTDFNNSTNPITAASQTVINMQACYVRAVFVGPGNGYNLETIHSLFACNEFTVIQHNGDLDQDSVLNYLEDLNNNGSVMDDNTDGTQGPNVNDNNDDNDNVLTINEDYNGNGSPLDDDLNNNGTTDYLDPYGIGPLLVNIRLFIEGYYTENRTMRPVKYLQDGVSPQDEVEDIVVELHERYTDITSSTIATLKTDGYATCIFPHASVPPFGCYIVVKTRNSIESWSGLTSVSNIVSNYDFSFNAARVMGNNQKFLGQNIYAFYSGDINQDGSIDATDAPDLINDVDSSAYGVYATDLNGDGSVDAADIPLFENNAQLSIYTINPWTD